MQTSRGDPLDHNRGWGWQLVAWVCPSLLLGACFGGEFAQGLPCTHDNDCGPQLSCTDGLCGGLGGERRCGNGLLETGEDCDDGNNIDDLTCTSDCRTPFNCGDGIVGADEECDDGNDDEGDACSSACTILTCGDGIVDPGEACDDANAVEVDECTTTCEHSPETPTLELSFSQVRQFEFSWAPARGAIDYQLLERRDVGEEFAPVAEGLTAESLALTMPLRSRLNASYILRACNELRCSESPPVDVVGTLAEAVGYFKASNTGAGDRFGGSVSLSSDGSTLAVSAESEGSSAKGIGGEQDDNSAWGSGAVYVFVRDGNAWSQQAYLKASNTDGGDHFGNSVALSSDGNTLAVSADTENSSAKGIGGDQDDNSASEAGAVYVFVRDSGVWSQEAYVKASNTDADDGFGGSVALSSNGNTMAVGADRERSGATGIDGDQADNSASEAGAVYVFVRDGEVWSQQSYIKRSKVWYSFGETVALSGDGNTLAVGSHDDSNAMGINGDEADISVPYAGAVYVYVRNGEIWSQQAYVKASNTGGSDSFGESVGLSNDGNTMAVGAAGESSSVAGGQENNSASDAGAVYVFVRDGEVWSQQAYVKASNIDPEDSFGQSVALSSDGSTLAVGATGEDSDAKGIDSDQASNSTADVGAVYVFVRSDEVWVQAAYLKASNPGPGYRFGRSVTLSGDGDILAVGSDEEKSSATGIGGDPFDDSVTGAGAVYLY